MKTQKKEALFISQKDNFAGNHGHVIRSSAVFYYKVSSSFSTTISFMNYWAVKRQLDVMIIASTRNMSGELKKREVLHFEQGQVINYQPILDIEIFEGSIEIEIFSNVHMVIPYAAIMAVYSAPDSISMVHSYGRTYSPHEVEEQRTIAIGHESCWTLRDDQNTRSFCVFHNGYNPCNSQKITLTLTNASGEKREISSELPVLAPYASYKLYPADHTEDLAAFLGGKAGNAALSYRLSHAFTRMLVGNETQEEFQVTHSNFNYGIHKTDLVETGRFAYMNIVDTEFQDAKVVVYPDCHQGQYTMHLGEKNYTFDGSTRLEKDVNHGTLVKFTRKDGTLPTRIVTAYEGKSTAKKAENISLPFECSLGVHHDDYPKKRSHWGIIAASQKTHSRLICHTQEDLFGQITTEDTINIRLYSPKNHEVIERELSVDIMKSLAKGLYLEELFPNIQSFLEGKTSNGDSSKDVNSNYHGSYDNNYGYIYITSSYPGLSCFTTIENDKGSMTFEHTF